MATAPDDRFVYSEHLRGFATRQLDYMMRVVAMSLPTIAFLIAAFGWKAADGLPIRLTITIAATAFSIAFLGVELWLLKFAGQANTEGRRVGVLPEDKGYFSEVGVRRMLWLKFGLCFVLVWGIFSASLIPAPSKNRSLPPGIEVGSAIVGYRLKAGDWTLASSTSGNADRYRVKAVDGTRVLLEAEWDADRHISAFKAVWVEFAEVTDYAVW